MKRIQKLLFSSIALASVLFSLTLCSRASEHEEKALQSSQFLNAFSHTQKSIHPRKILLFYSALPELEWVKRIERACTNIGWKCCSAFCGDFSIKEPLALEPASRSELTHLVEEICPDFTISLWDNQIFSENFPNYLCVTGGTSRFHQDTPHDISEVLRFNGILYASDEIDFLKTYFHQEKQTFHGIKWYPSCEATLFHAPNPNKIFYCGWARGSNRSSAEYAKMFTLLDQNGWLQVYGPKKRWEFVSCSWNGMLPFDGMSIRKAIQEAGITLVLHSSRHLEIGAPSSRVFEAAAAGSLIISDSHPFIMREFGDSVLYIDHTKSGQEMFEEIKNHMQWIFSHPQEARELAYRAHQIFLEKFTLESQLLELSHFFEKTR